jgi:hypothetical protein
MHNPTKGMSNPELAPMVDHLSMEAYIRRHREWGVKTFGPHARTKGVIDHIRKELSEIEAKPDDPSEWIDVVILAIDGYLRHGGAPSEFMMQLFAKQRVNFNRDWPNWEDASEDEAIEHVR